MNHLEMWQNSNTWGRHWQIRMTFMMKSRLNSGNACYYSVQNLLSSCLKKTYRLKYTKLFLVVLYGWETWSLNLREELRLRVFEKKVLRRIFWPKREEDGLLIKLHNGELHSLYSSPNIVRVIKSRRIRWVGHLTRIRERIGVYRALVGSPEGKRPLGRPRRRWEENIKLDLRETGIDGTN
jgi:hypothetical protein